MKKSVFILLIILSGIFALPAAADTLYLLDGSSAEFDTAVAKKLLQGAGWYKEPMVRMENAYGTNRKIVPIAEAYTMSGYTKISSIPLLDKNCNVMYVTSEDSPEFRDEELQQLTDPDTVQRTTKKKRLYTKNRELAIEVKPSWVDSYLQKGWYLPVTIYYPDGTTKEVLEFEKDEAVKNGGYEEPVLYVYKKDGEKKIIFQKDTEAAKAEGWATSAYITAYSSDGYTQIMTEEQEKASDEWYPYPVTRLYHVDGREAVVADSEKDKYLAEDWYTSPSRYVYAADLRCKLVALSEVPAWEAVGWYSYPVMTVYAEDGRTRVIPMDEYEAWYKVGWYAVPVVRMFSAYNPSVVIPVDEAAEWEAAGWRYVPMTLIYSIYGERAAVPTSEVNAWRESGWFDTVEEMEFTKIALEYMEYMENESYYSAIMFLKDVIYSPEKYTTALIGSVYEQYLYRMKAEAMDALRSTYGAPVAASAGEDLYVDGIPMSEVIVMNLSYEDTKLVSVVCEFEDYYGRGYPVQKKLDLKPVQLGPSDGEVLYVSREDLPPSYILTYAYPSYVIFKNGTHWEYR